MIHHFKVYNLVFIVFTELCGQHYCLILETLYPLTVITNVPLFSTLLLHSPWQPLIYFMSLLIFLFRAFHVNGSIQYVVF